MERASTVPYAIMFVMLVGTQGRLLILVYIYWRREPLTKTSLSRKHARYVSGWFYFLWRPLLMQIASKSAESKLLHYVRERLKYPRISTLGNIGQECSIYSS
jgi:hypothetical protein